MWLLSAWVLSHDSFCGKWAWAVRSFPAPDYVSYPRLLPSFTEYELNCVRRREDRPHFLIKRCPVGSHANFAKLNQCVIWDYPSASQARLFEMFFLLALFGSCSKGCSRCSLPMCFQFMTGSLPFQDWFLRCVIFFLHSVGGRVSFLWMWTRVRKFRNYTQGLKLDKVYMKHLHRGNQWKMVLNCSWGSCLSL